jgi:hypothetical protein
MPRQWRWAPPRQAHPQEAGFNPQLGSAGVEAAVDANTDSCFVNFFAPQCGHGVPCHLVERTSTSLSRPQPLQ